MIDSEAKQVTFKGIRPSTSVAWAVRDAFEKIEARVGRIDHAHVVVGPLAPFRVTIDLGYRHHHVFVVREAHDVYDAIDAAMQVVERQTLEVKRRLEDTRRCA